MYRIFIVEDDRGIADAVKTQAELWDLEARCVQNFRNVLEEFADFNPHLVLMDVALPCFLKRATPASTGAAIRRPAALGCTCAGESAGIWGIPSGPCWISAAVLWRCSP